jgi:hypothetical protein
MNQAAQPVSAGRWIGRVIVAVLVAEGVWGLIVSLTRDLIVPFLAGQTGGVSQSSQNVNVPGIFAAVIGLCLAGLVAVILNFWVNRPLRPTHVKTAAPRANVVGAASASLSIAPPTPQVPVAAAAAATALPTPVTLAPTVEQAPSAAPVAASKPMAPPPVPVVKPAPPPVSAPATAKPAPVAPPAKPAKPKPPKEIQYNIVGEPISPMDEDD